MEIIDLIISASISLYMVYSEFYLPLSELIHDLGLLNSSSTFLTYFDFELNRINFTKEYIFILQQVGFFKFGYYDSGFFDHFYAVYLYISSCGSLDELKFFFDFFKILSEQADINKFNFKEYSSKFPGSQANLQPILNHINFIYESEHSSNIFLVLHQIADWFIQFELGFYNNIDYDFMKAFFEVVKNEIITGRDCLELIERAESIRNSMSLK